MTFISGLLPTVSWLLETQQICHFPLPSFSQSGHFETLSKISTPLPLELYDPIKSLGSER